MGKIRSIRPLAPSVCPQCEGERTFIVTREKIECQRCGYVLRDEQNKPQPPVAPPPPKPEVPAERDLTRYKPYYRPTHRGEVETFVQAAFTTAMDYVHRQQWDEAIRSFKRCIDYRSDFIDGHLWLGYLLPDPAERRDHLTTVLAYEPSHPEAMRELLILDGQLEQPSDDFDEFTMPEVREVGGAVATKAKKMDCPRCGSPNLTDDDAQGVVYCTSCGYRQTKRDQANKLNLMAAALIKQRSKPVQWVVGERLLQCKGCGAKRTIPVEQLADTCPFCGSRNIIETDALDTFQQPEGILPFALTEKQVMPNVQEALKGLGERFKNLFNTNRVKRSVIEGVFLPFWVYDAVVEIQRTTIDTRGYYDRDQPKRANPYQSEQIPEMMNNILVCAVQSPPRGMTSQLGKYRLDRVVTYDPQMIVQHAAELYSIEFDKAVMDAHEIISTTMRSKYSVATGSSEVKVNITSLVKQMTFRLLLLPVYSVTLFEEDGEVRPVLVNGQTGKVVLGKASKPGR